MNYIFNYKRTVQDENGFSLVEFFVVLTIIVTLISLLSPFSKFMIRKSREREGGLLIRSYLEAAKLYFGENGRAPKNYQDLSKYVSVRACRVLDPKQCKKLTSIKPQRLKQWNSVDGNYIIVMDTEVPLYTKFYAIPHKKSTQQLSIFGCVNTQSGRRKITVHNSNLHLLKYHSYC
tara:strand:- start:523 stop:1050 length:528 start_codon:yes stop_codon:yes gene_type:complete